MTKLSDIAREDQELKSKPTPMEKWLFAYNKVKEYEELKDKYAEELLEDIDATGQRAIESPDGGTIEIHERTTYKFSEHIKKMTDLVNARKKVEIADGSATIDSITRHLSYRRLKAEPPQLT